jgi:hypothetical protein
MWGGAEFTPSLSGGVKSQKAVGLALVEKVRVPRGVMSSMHVEGESLLSLDLKSFGVRCSETFWAEDAQCLLLHPTG